MTIHEIYKETRSLPEEAREELVGLLVNDLAPVPPNSIRDREHLIRELDKSMTNPIHPVTDETWQQIRSEIHRRHSANRGAGSK